MIIALYQENMATLRPFGTFVQFWYIVPRNSGNRALTSLPALFRGGRRFEQSGDAVQQKSTRFSPASRS
jgi:hypothetical protein